MLTVEQFKALQPGDLFENGVLLGGVTDEHLVWVVEAVNPDGVELSVHYFDMYIVTVEAYLDQDCIRLRGEL